jgi:hypothetical protein
VTLRPRKQLLLKLAVFLLLGAILNVAVAWGSAVFLKRFPFSDGPVSADEILPYLDELGTEWVIRWRDFVRNKDIVWIERGFGARQLLVSVCSGRSCKFTALCAGVPCTALSGWNSEFDGTEQSRSGLMKREIPLVGDCEIPINPAWPGFAINTIFYAAILGLLFFAPGPIRRFIRIKRHRCAACGYQIAEGVGPVCSECGHPLTKASS